MTELYKSDIVVIGGVAAGPKTAATLARRLPNARITLFEKGEHISFGTCGLPYFASGDIDSFRELTVTSYGVPRDVDFFKNTKGFEVITGAEAVEIDRKSKTVTVKMSDNDEIYKHEYHKLVLATGATPVIPPFPTAASKKIRHFTRPEDAIEFRKTAQQGQIGKAVIVGGGFIGCELAEAAGGMWGIETVLVEKETALLPYVLDAEMAEIIHREMIRNNIELRLSSLVEKIELDTEGNPIVYIRNAEPITADFVFLCLGVRPNVELARKAGLEIGETGAVKVNRKMQTLDPDIYAGGDCVESECLITGRKFYIPMGSLANRHGHVIAENIAGNETEFCGVTGAFLVKVFDTNVGSVGINEITAIAAGLKAISVWGAFVDKPDYYPESKSFTLKMI
ncbi:MAG: FAD-dependent oxidoreductase, partial [Candidatus Zixiibacteriota bacterium]